MAYCTVEDVRKTLTPDGDNPELDGDTAAGLSVETMEDAIGRATAFIHTYIGSRYAVPVVASADPDGILRDWCSVIAAWYATLTFSGGRDIGADDPLRLRYNTVVRTIERVQSGNLSPDWPVETDNALDDMAIVNRYDGQMFGMDDFNIGDSRRPWGWGTLPGWP